MPEETATATSHESSTVNLQEPYEVEFWTQRLGCSREELESAVKAVGPEPAQIASFLKPGEDLPLTRIRLQNFRSFRDLEVGPFKRINLIAGLNNSGKTGLLEAIFLALHRGDAEARTRPANLPHLFRVFSADTDLTQNFWPWLFRNRNSAEDIRLSVFGNGMENEILICEPSTVRPPGHFGFNHEYEDLGPFQLRSKGALGSSPRPAVFASRPADPVQDAIDYNRVILKRKKKKVEELLRLIEPRLLGVEALQTGNRPLIYADLGLAEMIPVAHLGEGFCRLLDIYSELLAGDAQVLLIDEIENGLHHSVLQTVWKGLFAAARELKVQIFATTHSAECIFAADQAARGERPYDLNLIRLDRIDEEIKATIVDEDAMETARKFHWELR